MDSFPETDRWPFVRARYFRKMTERRNVRLIVIHSMEAPEKGSTAEAVANYFATTTRKASAHVCVDNNSVVQCVYDNDIAYAAPGANNDGIHIELAGYAKQTSKEWLDEYSKAVLENAANVAAQYCCKYGIPPVHLSNEELDADAWGVVGHDQVSDVFRMSTHTDPGKGFPWDYFIKRVQHFRQLRCAEKGV